MIKPTEIMLSSAPSIDILSLIRCATCFQVSICEMDRPVNIRSSSFHHLLKLLGGFFPFSSEEHDTGVKEPSSYGETGQNMADISIDNGYLLYIPDTDEPAPTPYWKTFMAVGKLAEHIGYENDDLGSDQFYLLDEDENLLAVQMLEPIDENGALSLIHI